MWSTKLTQILLLLVSLSKSPVVIELAWRVRTGAHRGLIAWRLKGWHFPSPFMLNAYSGGLFFY